MRLLVACAVVLTANHNVISWLWKRISDHGRRG
jgi:hypothetical protein